MDKYFLLAGESVPLWLAIPLALLLVAGIVFWAINLLAMHRLMRPAAKAIDRAAKMQGALDALFYSGERLAVAERACDDAAVTAAAKGELAKLQGTMEQLRERSQPALPQEAEYWNALEKDANAATMQAEAIAEKARQDAACHQRALGEIAEAEERLNGLRGQTWFDLYWIEAFLADARQALGSGAYLLASERAQQVVDLADETEVRTLIEECRREIEASAGPDGQLPALVLQARHVLREAMWLVACGEGWRAREPVSLARRLLQEAKEEAAVLPLPVESVGEVDGSLAVVQYDVEAEAVPPQVVPSGGCGDERQAQVAEPVLMLESPGLSALRQAQGGLATGLPPVDADQVCSGQVEPAECADNPLHQEGKGQSPEGEPPVISIRLDGPRVKGFDHDQFLDAMREVHGPVQEDKEKAPSATVGEAVLVALPADEEPAVRELTEDEAAAILLEPDPDAEACAAYRMLNRPSDLPPVLEPADPKADLLALPEGEGDEEEVHLAELVPDDQLEVSPDAVLELPPAEEDSGKAKPDDSEESGVPLLDEDTYGIELPVNQRAKRDKS